MHSPAQSRSSPRSHSRCGVCTGRLGASTTERRHQMLGHVAQQLLAGAIFDFALDRLPESQFEQAVIQKRLAQLDRRRAWRSGR